MKRQKCENCGQYLTGHHRCPERIDSTAVNIDLRRENLANNKKISENTKKLILNFIDEQGIGSLRQAKYLHLLPELLEQLGMEIGEACKEKNHSALKKLVYQHVNARKLANGKDASDWYRCDMRMALKTFIKYVEGIEFNPLRYKWLTTSLKTGQKKSRIEDNEVLNIEEIESLIEKADSLRNKCIISFAYETAVRPQELRKIRYKDVKVSDSIIKVWVNFPKPGTPKRYSKPITIKSSAFPLIKEWLKMHPTGKPDDLLFCLTNGLEIPGPTYNKMIHATAKRAGIVKPVTPYLLRHARISHLRINGHFTDDVVKKWSGHTKASPNYEVYTHIDDQTAEKIALEADGIKSAGPPIRTSLKQPVVCPHCFTPNVFNARICSTDGCNYDFRQPLFAKSEMDELKKDMQEMREIQEQNHKLIRDMSTENNYRLTIGDKPLTKESAKTMRNALPLATKGVKKMGIIGQDKDFTHFNVEFDDDDNVSDNQLVKDFIKKSIHTTQQLTGQRVVEGNMENDQLILILDSGDHVPINIGKPSQTPETLMGLERKARK